MTMPSMFTFVTPYRKNLQQRQPTKPAGVFCRQCDGVSVNEVKDRQFYAIYG